MSSLKDTAKAYILLVDDNPRHLERAKQWMNRYGYTRLDTARSAGETNEKLQQNHYDIIVADMRMEADHSGFEIIEKVKELKINSVVIIFTANDTVEGCRKSFKTGAKDYISKNMRGNPFEELHKSIQESLFYLNWWGGNKRDLEWIDENMNDLYTDYPDKFVAVRNNTVIESADTEDEIIQLIQSQGLPIFSTAIRKIIRRVSAEQLENELKRLTMPVVYVEGKTDEAILNTAWKKLYAEKPMPVVIKNCDLLLEDSDGGAAGAGTLIKLISAVREDSPCTAIGILDRDNEGIKSKKSLPNNFFSDIDEIDATVSAHRKSAAFLLPIPPGKEKYEAYENLSIEFYFSESALSQKTSDGRGLELRRRKRKISIGKITEEITVEDDEAREIKGNKWAFAQRVVPELEPSEFEPFRMIFDQIEKVLEYLQEGSN